MLNKILITGCSSGLGRALALHFANQGIKIYAVSRDQNKLKTLAEHSNLIIPIIADIATSAGRAHITQTLLSEGPLSIIHNAAYEQPSTFANLTEKNLRQHFETNCIAPLLITQSLLPCLSEGQRVLHITSGAAQRPLVGVLPYCITKAAFQHAATCLDQELSSLGILCSSLRPGMVDTPLQERWRATDKALLPERDYYIQQAENNQLISPTLAAEFVSWVMLKTEAGQFSKTIWSIYEKDYQAAWLGDRRFPS